MSFVHTHVHTEYSLLDGACRIDELVAQAKAFGMPAIALTDHGSLYGAIEFYRAAKKVGIKPIIGCEVYMAPGSMHERKSTNGRDAAYHFVLLAKNDQGYRNLIKLVTAAHLEGVYYKPRIDKEILAKHCEGLIGTSACLKNEIAQAVLDNRLKDAEQSIDDFKNIFAQGDFYLEIHNHGILAEDQVRARYADFSKKLKVPLLAANDVHFLKREHAAAHDILLCIQTGAHLSDEKRMRSPGPEFYLKSPDEMRQLFADYPSAIESTLAIAEKCDLEIELGANKYPAYQPPEGVSREAFFRKLCHEGLWQRYGERAENDAELKSRLEYEIAVIEKMGFVSYFLIVWDFIDFAKRNGIPVGPGRGSGAGSLVAYVLKITDLDPLRYGLIFERFLNPERISPPDIDIDFCQDRREEVIQYVRQKYGERSVAQIITFGTLGAKMAVRDVARVMGMSFSEASRIADLIPRDPKITIQKALNEVPELRRIHQDEESVHEIIEHAKTLEGLSRQTGIHAAGVVIADGDLTEYLPLTRDDKGDVVTQYAMESVGDIGLLKMDFLGLKTLTVIKDCCEFIEQSAGAKLDIQTIPLDDPKTFELLNKAQNVGVFQVESPGMRRTCEIFDIQKIDDIIALIALYRPGPMDLIDEYVKRKKGLISFEYEHPLLEQICSDTYGIMIYQEQVMSAARILAGYTLGDADLLRRAMGKKKKEEMDQQRARFIKGCLEKNDIPREKAESIFELLEKFAGYGFNKSHSAAYGLLSYQTAYLKANYPVEFMAALLSNELDNTDKIALFIAEAKNLGIRILSPSVNESRLRFTIGKGEIRFGLAAIKNVGHNAVQALLDARDTGGAFTSLQDFCRRIDIHAINKKTVESLIKAGAFDSLHSNRASLFAEIDSVLAQASSIAREKQSGQESFFSVLETSTEIPTRKSSKIKEVADWPLREKLAYEKELLGFYLTGHPADEFEADLRAFRTLQLGEASEASGLVRIAGILASMEVRTTQKDRKPYARLMIEDLTGRMEIMIFTEMYRQIGMSLKEGTPFIISGTIEEQDDGRSRFRVVEMLTLTEACNRLIKEIHLVIDREGDLKKIFEDIKKTIIDFQGEQPLCFLMSAEEGGKVLIEAGASYRIRSSHELLLCLRNLLGPNNVRIAAKAISAPPPRRRFVRQTSD